MAQSHHSSFSLANGSRVFSVEGRLFKIPNALLSLHSEVFISDERFQNPGEEPIVLDDSASDFQEFCEALLMPYDSCLMKENPELDKVMGLFAIAHKYCATKLESRARSLALSMTLPQTIRNNLTNDFSSIKLVEKAHILPCPEIVSEAWSLVIEDLKGDKIGAHEILGVAERTKNRRLIGEAYYNIMLLGQRAWSSNPNLTDEHRQNLSNGTIKFVEEWDEITQLWASGHPGLRHNCNKNYLCASRHLANILVSPPERQIASCDLLARLDIASKPGDARNFGSPEMSYPTYVMDSPTSPSPLTQTTLTCREAFGAYAVQRREKAEKALITYFIGRTLSIPIINVVLPSRAPTPRSAHGAANP